MEQTLPPLVRFTPVHEDAMVCEADGAYVRIADAESELTKTREVVQSLVDVMHLIHPSCMILHHEPSEKHADHEACPVKARFYNVLALAKSQLQIEPTK